MKPFDNLTTVVTKATKKNKVTNNKLEKGDNRTRLQKIVGAVKVLIVVLLISYLGVIHFLAGLYATDNRLVLKVETAQLHNVALVSPK